MIARLGGLGARLLDLAIPPRCAGCGERDAWLCVECRAALPRLPAEHCARCAAPGVPTQLCGACYRRPPSFDALGAPFLHDGLARELVLALKYRGQRHLAAELGRPMILAAPPDVDLIVPVPLHPERRDQRGFNQSELLARSVAAGLGLICQPNVLSRVRKTPPQTGLSPASRIANVRNAFECASSLIGARVLLVDDVCTTGATLAACARALRLAGATRVAAVTATRAATLQ